MNAITKKQYFALDIGTTKIVLLVATKNEYGKIQVLGYGQAPTRGMDCGTVVNGLEVSKAILEAVNQVRDKMGIDPKNVVISIIGKIRTEFRSNYIVRSNPKELVGAADMRQLEQQIAALNLSPGEQVLQIVPQWFKMSDGVKTKEAIGLVGERLEANYLAVIGNQADIENVCACVKRSDLEPTKTILQPIASAQAVLNEEEMEAGVALVDIGGGTTDIAIFKNGVLKSTAVIKLGGNHITKRIRELTGILPKEAEALKLQFGCAWPGALENSSSTYVMIGKYGNKEPDKKISTGRLAEIIYEASEEILTQVVNVLKAYGYQDPEKRLDAGIVLTGGGAQLKEIDLVMTYLSKIVNTRIGLPSAKVAGDTDDKLISPVYSTAIGLICTAIEEDEKEESLVNKESFKAMLESNLKKKFSVEEDQEDLPEESYTIPDDDDDFEDDEEQKKSGFKSTFINSINSIKTFFNKQSEEK